jgi:hypothetical protein
MDFGTGAGLSEAAGARNAPAAGGLGGSAPGLTGGDKEGEAIRSPDLREIGAGWQNLLQSS